MDRIEIQVKTVIAFCNRHAFNILLVSIPLFLLGIYVSLIGYNRNVENEIQLLGTISKIAANSETSYPVIRNEYLPYITAQSAIILDDQSQAVLFARNPNLRFSMASTTKIMTALVALEHYKEQDILTVFSPYIEGAEVGYDEGERVYFIDNLYGMMLPSGNDAAYAMADNYPGGVEAFVAKMNEKARQLHLYNTHYADPAGLNDDGNYTTAQDLARLASIALKNKTVARVAATRDRVITNVDGTKIYSLYNLNRLLGSNGVTGLKTGFTQGAGGVLVTSKIENGRTFIIVVIKSEDRFSDTLQLLSYISNNLVYFSPKTN